MKAVKISLLLILLVFLCAGLSYAQSSENHSYNGMEYGAAGNLEAAKAESLGRKPDPDFAKSLEPYREKK